MAVKSGIKQTESYKLNVIWNTIYGTIFNCCWRVCSTTDILL